MPYSPGLSISLLVEEVSYHAGTALVRRTTPWDSARSGAYPLRVCIVNIQRSE